MVRVELVVDGEVRWAAEAPTEEEAMWMLLGRNGPPASPAWRKPSIPDPAPQPWITRPSLADVGTPVPPMGEPYT